MELLERVVGQDRRTGALGDLQHERVASSDCSGRWCQEFTSDRGFLVDLTLGGIDSVRKGCVHHDHDVVEVVLLGEVAHRFVELRERGRGATFGCNVGSVNDEV